MSHFDAVPIDYAENLKWRDSLLKQCERESAYRKQVTNMCREDVLFFFGAMCWLFEPRRRTDENGKRLPPRVPFIPWPHQVEPIRSIREALGVQDVVVEKSRGEGASWIMVLLALQDWLFEPMAQIGLVSSKEKNVDIPNNLNTLMGKLDWEMEQLPLWLTGVKEIDWKRTVNNHTFTRVSSKAAITGYAATADLASGSRALWFGPQPLSAGILTPTGWTTMGEVLVGDRVIGGDGKSCRVEAVIPQGIQDVYEIEFTDGSITHSTANHLWSVQTTGMRHTKLRKTGKPSGIWKTMQLSEMMGDYITRTNNTFKKKYHIPITEPVEYDPVRLPLDPYMVGCLIGDGYVGSSLPCLASDDDEIVEEVKRHLPDGVEMIKKRHQIYNIRRVGNHGQNNALKDIFKSLGICVTGVDKHIPEIYKRASVWQRLQMIRGLMDTDGHLQHNKGKRDKPTSFTVFTTISRRLALDFTEIIESLGGTCLTKSYIPECTWKGKKVKGKRYYSVSPTMPDGMCPFKLKRKAERYVDRKKYKAMRAIKNIVKIGPMPVQCIKVDNKKGLYLTDNFIVTHNCDELSKFPKPDDEAALTAVQQVTESRFIVGTPWGASGAFYELTHSPHGEDTLRKILLAWEDNPTRNRGLYKMKGNRPIPIDAENNPLHPDYDPPTKNVVERFNRLRRKGYILQKGIRSPWFDKECDRPRATPVSIAQELSRDYGGSQAAIFGDVPMQLMADTIEPEMIRGNLGYHPETLAWDWDRADDGECFLWCPLDSKGQPPEGRYVASADIAVGDGGSYTSNSVLTVVNVATREQVMEWTSNTTSPHDFADFSVAVCRWFHNAHLAWEQNGPGGPYSRQVLENIGYEDVFRRVVLSKRSRKRTKEYGWWTDQRSKEILFSDMIAALKEGELIVRSKLIREEAIQYVRVGDYIRHGGYSTKGLRDNQSHGDRVIAIAVGVQAMKDMPMQPKVMKKINVQNIKDPPINSLAWRQQYFRNLANKNVDGIDTRTLRDLMK